MLGGAGEGVHGLDLVLHAGSPGHLFEVRKDGEVAALPPQPRVQAVYHPLLAPVVVAQGLQLGELAARGDEPAVQVGGALPDGVDDEGKQDEQENQHTCADHQKLFAPLKHEEVVHGVPFGPFGARRLSRNCTVLFAPWRVLLIVTSSRRGDAARALCRLTTLS